jgi:hypothetical protein
MCDVILGKIKICSRHLFALSHNIVTVQKSNQHHLLGIEPHTFFSYHFKCMLSCTQADKNRNPVLITVRRAYQQRVRKACAQNSGNGDANASAGISNSILALLP